MSDEKHTTVTANADTGEYTTDLGDGSPITTSVAETEAPSECDDDTDTGIAPV